MRTCQTQHTTVCSMYTVCYNRYGVTEETGLYMDTVLYLHTTHPAGHICPSPGLIISLNYTCCSRTVCMMLLRAVCLVSAGESHNSWVVSAHLQRRGATQDSDKRCTQHAHPHPHPRTHTHTHTHTHARTHARSGPEECGGD